MAVHFLVADPRPQPSYSSVAKYIVLYTTPAIGLRTIVKVFMEPLQNLTPQSAAIGEWLICAVTDPMEIEYEWKKGTKKGTSKKIMTLFASEDSAVYCTGVYRKIGAEPRASQEFAAMKEKMKKGLTWKISKVSFVIDKPQYIASPVKYVIDMKTTKFTPVLQSIVPMPKQATPADDLNALLSCPNQRVDVIALIKGFSEPCQRVTSQGNRLMSNITIIDDSGDKGAATSEITLWFSTSSSGTAKISQLREAQEKNVPVAFFNLSCLPGNSPSDGSSPKNTLYATKDHFFWQACEQGDKATRLKAKATELLAKDKDSILVVTELPTFIPRESIDYINMQASLTSCKLLDYTLRGGTALLDSSTKDATQYDPGAPEHGHLFQINNCRIIEPPKGQDYCTKDARLFPLVKVVDATGSIEIRMREKTVLDLLNIGTAQEFVELANEQALNFPILCSIRVYLSKNKDSDYDLSAIIVEATSQDILAPKARPNTSMNFLLALLSTLPPDSDRMLVAPISQVDCKPHEGMIVVTEEGHSMKATSILSLIAHTGRSKIHNLSGGHKIISKDAWSIPFNGLTFATPPGAPEHADSKLNGELASYCNMNNVQDYTLTARNPKETVYAMILISSVYKTGDLHTYMIDKVHIVQEIKPIISYMEQLSKFFNVEHCHGKPNATPDWKEDVTPYKAKKPRALSLSPTDAPLPNSS